MPIETIRNREHLELFLDEDQLVFVAALKADFQPGDLEFERIAQENNEGKCSFAKFIVEETPDVVDDFECNDDATVVTFVGGQKEETVAGFEPSKWEDMVKKWIEIV